MSEEIFSVWANSEPSRSMTIVRPVVIFGENNRGNVYNLMRQIALGKFIMVGKGQNKKSMAYVENFCAFLLFSANFSQGIHVYNYADKPDITMQELIAFIYYYMGKKQTKLYIPYILGLVGGTILDFVSLILRKKFSISAIRIRKFCANTQVSAELLQNIDFKPPLSLVDGLRKMIDYEFGKSTI